MQEAIAKTKPVLSYLLPLTLVTMLALLVSCSEQATYTDVTVEEAQEIIDQQEVVVLDVRTVEEYNSSHIPDALLIPVSELESRLDELNPSDRILVYCKSGVRSAKAAGILVDNGFTCVFNMEGGIIEWQAHSFPVTQAEESLAVVRNFFAHKAAAWLPKSS